MKKTRVLFVMLIASILLIASMPSFAVSAAGVPRINRSAPELNVPIGYDSSDYQQMVEFLSIADENGVTNGKKLNNSFNAANPTTWTGINWKSVNGVKKLYLINIVNKGLVGSLALSGCTQLQYIDCSWNNIESVSVNDCALLRYLYVHSNKLTNLSISGSTYINYFNCEDNKLRRIDLSHVNGARIDEINASCDGFVGCYSVGGLTHVAAVPAPGEEFRGWYSSTGELISASPIFSITTNMNITLVGSFSGEMYPTPEGYNAHDYRAVISFLEQADASGVKNGMKINADYNPLVPETLLASNSIEVFMWVEVEGELRLQEFDIEPYNGAEFASTVPMVGVLDLSDCTALERFYIRCQEITALNVSGCTSLASFYCEGNQLTEIDISGCTALMGFDCNYNMLTEIDTSTNPLLWRIDCCNNPITELDISGCTGFQTDIEADNMILEVFPDYQVEAIGNGKFSSHFSYLYGYFIATPDEGERFLGWYNVDTGEYSNSAWLSNTQFDSYIAYFTIDGELPFIPEGYNAHDYMAVINFFEQTDSNGVKNGIKLNPDYNPLDPTTLKNQYNNYMFTWTNINGELRLYAAYIDAISSNGIAAGVLDLSGCSELYYVQGRRQGLTAVDFSGCSTLRGCYLDDNRIEQLDVSGCSSLRQLECNNNLLTELDISDCTELFNLECNYNLLTRIDASSNINLDTGICYVECTGITELILPSYQIISNGNGTIDCYIPYYERVITAVANEGEEFICWRHTDNEGNVEFIFEETLSPDSKLQGQYVAYFTGADDLPMVNN